MLSLPRFPVTPFCEAGAIKAIARVIYSSLQISDWAIPANHSPTLQRYLHGGLSRASIRHVKRNRADAFAEFIYQVIQSSWVARCGD
jgi:hypothetical protein